MPQNHPDHQPDDGWDRGWDEHKIRQMVRLSRLTMSQKLEWLEEMQRLLEKVSQSKNAQADQPKDS